MGVGKRTPDPLVERSRNEPGWSHEKKKALIEGDSNALHKYAECKNDTHSRNAERNQE